MSCGNKKASFFQSFLFCYVCESKDISGKYIHIHDESVGSLRTEQIKLFLNLRF